MPILWDDPVNLLPWSLPTLPYVAHTDYIYRWLRFHRTSGILRHRLYVLRGLPHTSTILGAAAQSGIQDGCPCKSHLRQRYFRDTSKV